MAVGASNSPILIIGGGAFGLSSAISLKKRGHPVTIFDRLPIPAQDSSSNDINRIVRTDYGGKAIEQELALKAIDKWRHWDKEARTVLNDNHPLFQECGILLTCSTTALGPYEESCIEHLTSLGFGEKLHRMEATTMASRFPGFADLTTTHVSGYLNTTGGMVDANRTLRYLRRIAEECGVKFLEGSLAGRIVELIEEASAVKGIRTADGVDHFGTVLVAAGAWSATLVGELRPILAASGQSVMYIKVPESIEKDYRPDVFPCWTADITQTGMFGFPSHNGIIKFACHSLGYLNPLPPKPSSTSTIPTTSPTSQQPISTPRTTVDSPSDTIPLAKYKTFRTFIETHFPKLAECEVVAAKLCWYCNTHDERFLISAVPKRPGLFVATGGSGHAFKFTPVLGNIIADVVTGVDNTYTRYFGWRDNPHSDDVYMPDGDGILADREFATL
ncbi:hypothetical protein HDV00_002133 [Rhizophlyctis rosea]|nr:hypothetical protein HDV00_002133 [Rhizophlyctis rosea]